MRDVTLCLIIDKENGRILLGNKKRGFGEGKLNGFGGKVKKGESIEDALVREIYEECGLLVYRHNLIKYGEIEFYFPRGKEDWCQKCHVFIAYLWDSDPRESEEMTNDWYNLTEVPYESMWDTDQHWMPYIVERGEKIVSEFYFNEDCNSVKDFRIDCVEDF